MHDRQRLPATGGTITAVEQRSPAKPRATSAKPAGSGARHAEQGRRASPTRNGQYRVRRFDADRRDHAISLDEAIASRPGTRQLVWIDVVGAIQPAEMDDLAKRFKFDLPTRHALERTAGQPRVAVHGSYFHVCVAGEPIPPRAAQPVWLDVIASRNVVITRHDDTLKLLDDIDRRIEADTTIGTIQGAEFVALLLDAVITGYFAAVDEIEDAIDDLDARSLLDDGRHHVLDDLVNLRRRIAKLRRVVTGLRALFAALAGPDMRQLVGADAASDLQSVASRYESAIGAVESSREALLGSFDVYMTRTAQRTNEVMKVLTVATVLLLPGSLIAGLLGMNVVVPLNKDDPTSFWLVIGGVALLAVVVIGVLRLRRWI